MSQIYTEQDVRSMHAKVKDSRQGLYAYVGKRPKLYNFWRYKFKKHGLPYPKSQKLLQTPISVLKYHRRWYATNTAKKKLYLLRDWSYQLGVCLPDDVLTNIITAKTNSLEQNKHVDHGKKK